MRALWLAVFLTILPTPVRAQAVDLTVPDAAAEELTEVRLSLNTERTESGLVLGIAGLASVIGGALVAGLGVDDPLWLAFGVGTLGWGAINIGFALTFFDFGGGRARSIEEDRALRGRELAEARERALRQQHETSTVYAIGVGLDLVYVVAGVLIYVLADQVSAVDDSRSLRGYSIAQISQGAFLIVFDLIEWIASTQRAERVAGVEPARW